MAYLVARVQHMSEHCLPERDRIPPVDRFAVRHRVQEPTMTEMRALLAANGWEMPDNFVTGREGLDWPYSAIVFVSPNSRGEGRIGSSLYTHPCRRRVVWDVMKRSADGSVEMSVSVKGFVLKFHEDGSLTVKSDDGEVRQMPANRVRMVPCLST